MTVDGTDNPNERGAAAGDIQCVAARDLVHRRIDGEASADQIDRLEAHLKQCPSCMRYAGETIEVMSQLASLRAASETPTRATAQPIENDSDAARHVRLRLGRARLRIAAVIAIGCAGIWAWSAWRDQSEVRLADGGAGLVDTNSIALNPGDGIKAGPSPGSTGNDIQAGLSARIINPRSRDSTYIPVRRDTGRADVKMFALYENVR